MSLILRQGLWRSGTLRKDNSYIWVDLDDWELWTPIISWGSLDVGIALSFLFEETRHPLFEEHQWPYLTMSILLKFHSVTFISIRLSNTPDMPNRNKYKISIWRRNLPTDKFCKILIYISRDWESTMHAVLAQGEWNHITLGWFYQYGYTYLIVKDWIMLPLHTYVEVPTSSTLKYNYIDPLQK